MKNSLTVFCILMLLAPLGAQSQTRAHSFLDGGRLYSYNINRYSPIWQIQSAAPQSAKPDATANTRFFREIKQNQVEPLKGLLFNKSSVTGVSGGASGMSDYLSRNSIVMYYQVTAGNYHIYLAYMNNSTFRSVIPFLENSGKWTLDVDFANTELFGLLSNPRFDPFSGKMAGIVHLSLGFESLEKGSLIDHSGRNQRTRVRNVAFTNGRVGRCLRLNPESQVDAEIKRGQNVTGTTLHCNTSLMLDAANGGTVLRAIDENGKKILELTSVPAKGKLVVDLEGTTTEVSVPKAQWFDLQVAAANGAVTITIDDSMPVSYKYAMPTTPSVVNLMIGGQGAATGLIDELTIGF